MLLHPQSVKLPMPAIPATPTLVPFLLLTISSAKIVQFIALGGPVKLFHEEFNAILSDQRAEMLITSPRMTATVFRFVYA